MNVFHFSAEGNQAIPKDSGLGNVGRPFAESASGQRGDRVATLETLYEFFINNVPDPDEALAQNSNADEIIRKHPDVHSAMRLRELTVASMPWHVEASDAPGIDDKLAKRIADYTQEVFNRIPGITDLYRMMQSAVLQGGTGVEWIWKPRNGAEVPVNYFPVHKTRFTFDREGRMAILTRTTPVYGSYVSPGNAGATGVQEPSPNAAYAPYMKQLATINGMGAYRALPGKFMYHKYMSEGGSWHRPAGEGYVYWGRGENANLWNLVCFDNFAVRFRMKWLERFGFPLTIVYYPAADENAKDRLVEVAESIKNETIASVPHPADGPPDQWYKIDYQQPSMQGTDAFSVFTEQYIKPRVEKILLGGANLLQVGDVGSYGATVDQRDAGADIIFRYDAQRISDTLNQQMVPHIVRSRWPDCPEEYLPKHIMAPKEAVDKQYELSTIQMAATMVPVQKTDVYKAAGVEAPNEDAEPDDILFLGSDPSMMGSLDGFPPAVIQDADGNDREAPPEDTVGNIKKVEMKKQGGNEPPTPIGSQPVPAGGALRS